MPPSDSQRASTVQEEHASARASILTLLPSLTGRKTTFEQDLITETSTSSLLLSHIEAVLCSYDVLLTTAFSFAWAQLLAVYTGSEDDIAFDCIFPTACDAADPSLQSPVTCTFSVREHAQSSIRDALCQYGRSNVTGPAQRSDRTSRAETVERRPRGGTLLDLKSLVGSSQSCGLSRDAHDDNPKYLVTLSIDTSANGPIVLQVSGCVGVLNEEAAQLLLAQYGHILKAISRSADEPINRLFSQYPGPLQSISHPEPKVSGNFMSLQSQFEEIAKSNPRHIALEFWTGENSKPSRPSTIWTYAELDQRAEHIAAELQGRFGSLIDQIVPICMDRCPEIYAAILGVLKTGAAWCPIDPSFPPIRRHGLIARTGAQALIINSQSPNDGIPEGVTTLDLSPIDWSQSREPKQVEIQPDYLAYLIWTSGTTGAPKGVPISHRAAVASMKALQTCIPTDVRQSSLRCLQFSQFTFDVFVQDLFYTWGLGGTLIAADRATMLGSFSDLATKSAATHAHLTPAFAASVSRVSCPTLEVVTMIGEKLTQNVADDWSKDCRLYNTYGPAEATVVAILRLVPDEDMVQSANVGLPLPSVSAFVIYGGEVVMRNGIGELALAGPQLSNGYWKDATKTKERFVWNERLQTTLYMTGDIVRQLYDGTFEFVGRTDDLIKIQGIRVELSEIAFALRSCHPQVQQVEVCFLERPDRHSKVIVAFLAAPTSTACNPETLEDERGVEVARKALNVARTQLPDYMIPKVFLVVGVIPRTSSAKVDRGAMQRLYTDIDIRSWEQNLGYTSNDGIAAADLSPIEMTIIEIICNLTGTSKDTLSRQSTLPSIGVDSITATRLAFEFRIQGIAISVAEILQCTSLDHLLQYSHNRCPETTAKRLDTSAFQNGIVASLRPDVADRVELVLPALPLQESLLSESFQNPNAYWSNTFFELNDGIDLQRLERAWEDVAKRTEALRATFCPVADIPKQVQTKATFLQLILAESHIDWTIIKASENNFDTIAKNCARKIARRRQERRFGEPLWAVTVFSLSSRTIMMVSIHHAIRDEPSLDILMAEVANVYMSKVESPLPQNHQLRDAVSLLYTAEVRQVELDEQFWSDSLSAFSDGDDSKSWPELKLADDGRIEGTVTYCWTAEDSYKHLRLRSASIGAASLAAVLRVVWGCILLEYLETDKVVFGETWSARGEAPELSDAVAPLVLVLPVPFRVENTWRETLQSTANIQQQSKGHHGVHPRSIRKILGRSEGVALYPAIFNFVPETTEQLPSGQSLLWRKIEDIVELCVEHAIAFNAVIANDDTLRFELTALKRCMDMEHLQLLASQIDGLLNIILDNPDGQCTQYSAQMPPNLLSLVSSEEQPAKNLAKMQSPTHWVDHNAALHPTWIAAEVVSSVDKTKVTSNKWSYEQLQTAYRNVASLISEFGYRKRMIAVCLDRRLELYSAILGIMSTGNTYLPIADDLPKERRLFLLHDSDAAMLLTTRSLATTLSSVCHTVFVEDLDYSKPVQYSPDVRPQATDDAYLLYTSGSTGAPKGVVVSRGNLTSFIEAITHFIDSHVEMTSLQGKGKWLGMASYAFDVHLLEMFFAWRHGMATVTADRGLLLDNLELALQKFEVTHASFVPSVVDNAGLGPANLPDLRYMSLGGEKISKKAIDTWSRSHVVLANAYGPTEATIGCCFRRMEPSSNVRNIGFPLSYTTAHVLRPGTFEYVLRGTPGELCLTGDLVATGYLNRPDAKGFVEDFHGNRMYRTGDRVCLMADGSLEFLGRDDDQTKIRGQRIELGEVSEAVRSAASKSLRGGSIEVTSLVAQHRALNRPQLVSFVATPEKSRNATNIAPTVIGFPGNETAEEIRRHCRNVLPSFMVPDHLIRLTSLPLVSTSRKVDAKQLRMMFSDIPLDDMMSNNVLPTPGAHALNFVETTVRDQVVQVLGVDPAALSPNSNFFQFGLDSLNAISLAIKLQKQEFECSVSQLLRNPTIRAIAGCTTSEKVNGKTFNVPNLIADFEQRFRSRGSNGIDLANVAAVWPCLPLQETLVASSMDHEGEALYVNHVLFELSPDVDHQRLLQAWVQTAERHEILRTCFYEFEKHFIQLVLKDSALSCERVRTGAADDLFTDLRQRQSETALEIIANIEKKPPIRLTLATSRLVQEKALFLVSVHHALYDQESFALLLDEVYALYQGVESTGPHTPVTKLMEHIDSRNQSDAEAFWIRYLTDYKPPTSVDPAMDNQTKSTSIEIATSLTDLESLAASTNGTLASLVQALFGIVLAETLQIDDVVFGTVLSGRTVPMEGAHSIIAPCITTIPQRVQVDRTSSLRDIVHSAQKGFVGSIEYQHTALRDIHRWVEAKNPLFDTLFTFTRKASKAQWAHLWREVESTMSSGFPLAVEILADQATDRVSVRCDFSAAFGTLERANGLVERLQHLLQTLVQGKTANLKIPSVQRSEKLSPIIANGNHGTKEEMVMRDIISVILGLDPKAITRETTFFALGLDSIMAIQFAKRLRQRDIQCSSADVMRYPSIAALAQHIAAKTICGCDSNGAPKGPQLSSSSPGKPMNGKPKTYPCTPLQSSMLTQTMGSDESLYVHHHAIRFPEECDAATLRKAWEIVVDGTEILRTGFQFSGELKAWSAMVYEDAPMTWNEHNPSLKLEQAIHMIKQEMMFGQETDFARPPWRVDTVGDVFILSLHHSLYDGESIRLLIQDFWTASKGNPLSERPSFSLTAEEIHRRKSDAEDYWVQTLNQFRGKPTRASHGPTKETRATLVIDLAGVLEGCRKLGVTLQSVALVAFGKTIASLAKRDDIVFGHVVSGRSLPALNADEIIGPLFNTVPVRLDLEKASTSNKDAVHYIQRMTGESQIYQHASLSKIQQAWRKEIGNPDAELLDSLFVFQRRTTSEEEFWETVRLEDDDVAPTEYATNFEWEQTDSGINICVNSRSIEDLPSVIKTFERMLCDILDKPDTAVTAVLEDQSPLGTTVSDQSEGSNVPAIPNSRIAANTLGTIRRLLAKVSGIPTDNITDNASIFSLGLDSLSAIQIAATARKEGVKLSVADILQGRTLKGICQRLTDSQEEKAILNGLIEHSTTSNPPPHLLSNATKSKALSLSGLPSTSIEAILPCLPGQTYHLLMWLASGRTLGEGTFTYTCRGHLSPPHLLSAWRGLRSRHPILRTTFTAPSPTEAVQIILKPSEIRSDCFQCLEYNAPETLCGVVQQVSSRRFDSFTPPVELTLARSGTGEGNDHIILKLHHALYDAYTIPVLIADLSALYTQIQKPLSPSLPPLPSSSTALITALLPSPNTTTLAQTLWRQSLSSFSPTILSSSSTSSQQPHQPFTTTTHTLPHLHHLENTSRHLHTTLPTLLLLSHARVLARRTKIPNPTFGLFQTGRSSSSSLGETQSRSCIPYLNVLPLTIHNALGPDIRAAVEGVQSDLAARVPYEQGSLREILRWIGEEEGAMFNTFVNILWTASPAGSPSEDDTLFEAWNSEGVVAPRTRVPGRTGLDGLDTRVLARRNLFLDIQRCDLTDTVKLFGRCDTGVLGEGGVEEFLEEIGEEVEKLVEVLEGQEGTRSGEIEFD